VTRAGAWTTVIVLCCICSSAAAIGTASSRQLVSVGQDPNGTATDRAMLVWLVGIVIAIAMIWRHRWPLQITVISAVAPILLPLDALAALVCLGGIVRRRDLKQSLPAGLLVAVAVWRSVWQDSRGTSDDTSFWHTIASPGEGHAVRWWVVLIITAVLIAVTVGISALLRSRHDLSMSRRQEERADQKAEALSETVARQQERERLAREVHDALGHRLSLLSIHAGALEVAAQDNPKLAQSAAVVRTGAQQSMEDLRSLLTVLRQPGEADVAAAVPELADVPRLVDETVAAGQSVVSSVVISTLEGLDPLVSRSAYRVVQELLTNARKHAAGMPLRLQVTANPSLGIDISAGNLIRQAAPDAPRFNLGNGLTGLSERVEQLGGQWRVWIDESGAFRVAVLLPWTRGVDHD